MLCTDKETVHNMDYGVLGHRQAKQGEQTSLMGMGDWSISREGRQV